MTWADEEAMATARAVAVADRQREVDAGEARLRRLMQCPEVDAEEGR